MQDTVKVYRRETANRIYNIAFRVTAKTSYEQREEQRKEFLYMTFQKALGLILIAIGVIPAIYHSNILTLLYTSFIWLIGLAVICTKDHVVTI